MISRQWSMYNWVGQEKETGVPGEKPSNPK